MQSISQAINCVKGEVHNVLTVLRLNPPRGDANITHGHTNKQSINASLRASDTPLVRSLQALYDRVGELDSIEWSSIPVLEFLAPFLAVIDSPSIDIFATAAALHSVHKFLVYGLLNDRGESASAGLNACVASVCRAQFEVRDREDAEIVAMKVLDTLMECIRVEPSRMLSNDSIIQCAQECLAVRERHGASKLLKRYAENTLMQMVLLLFKRLPVVNQSIKLVDGQPVQSTSISDRNGRASTSPEPDTELQSIDENNDLSINHSIDLADNQSFHPGGYGVDALQRVFLMIVDLIAPPTSNQTLPPAQILAADNDRILGLRVIRTVLETGGTRLNDYPPLVSVIQDKLCKYLLQISQTRHLFILSLVLRIVFDLFQSVKLHLRVQLEVFFVSIHLRIGESFNSSPDQRELVMESLVEFCREPSLIVGLYRNYDCEIGATDLFQDLCRFLGQRCSLSSGSQVTRSECLALEAMVAVLTSIDKRFCETALVVDDATSAIRSGSIALARGASPIFLSSNSDIDDSVESSAEEEALLLKTRADKQRYSLAAQKFNSEGAKSFKFLQSIHVLSDPITPESIVSFFRSTPGLNKAKIGDFLGGHEPLNVQTLSAFVATCKFDPSTSIDDALRSFLELFLLPGESQQIARIMEKFAEVFYTQCPGPLLHADAAYVLAYSVIMLNTDAHNSQVPKKMTREEFVRNLRGINARQDLPFEYLSNLYDSITQHEIKMKSDSLSELASSENSSISQREWSRVVHSSKGSKFQTRAPRTHGRDMFMLIWQSAVATFSAYLDNRELHTQGLTDSQAESQPDAKLLNKIVAGIQSFARICSVYELNDSINSLVIALSRSLTSILIEINADSSGWSPAAAFARDRRARLVCSTLLTLVRQYGERHLFEAWPNVLHCLLWLRMLRLLPESLTDMEDFRDSSGGKLESLRKLNEDDMREAEKRKQIAQASQSRLSYFVSFLFTEEEAAKPVTTDSDAGQLSDEDWKKIGRDCVARCNINDMFSSTKHFTVQSLSYLTRSLFLVSAYATQTNPVRSPNSGLELFSAAVLNEESAVFALERLTDIVEWNAARLADPTLKLWATLYDHCYHALSHARPEPTFYIERLVVNVLRFSVRLLPPLCCNPSVTVNQCLQLLSLLLLLPLPSLHALATRITAGLSIFVQTQCEAIQTTDGFGALTKLLLTFRLSSQAAHSAFAAFQHCVENATSPLNFMLFVNCTYQFSAHPQNNGESVYLPINESQTIPLVIRLHNKIATFDHALQHLAPQAREAEKCRMWLESLRAMSAAAVGDVRPTMRRLAVDALTTSLLTSSNPAITFVPGSQFSSCTLSWIGCVSTVLIPLVEGAARFPPEITSGAALLALENQQAQVISPSSRRTLTQSPHPARQSSHPQQQPFIQPYNIHEKALALLFQTMLHRMAAMTIDTTQFSTFWLTFLPFLQQQRAIAKPEQAVQIVESFKNLLFILAADGIIQQLRHHDSFISATTEFVKSLGDDGEQLIILLQHDSSQQPAAPPAHIKPSDMYVAQPVAHIKPSDTSVAQPWAGTSMQQHHIPVNTAPAVAASVPHQVATDSQHQQIGIQPVAVAEPSVDPALTRVQTVSAHPPPVQPQSVRPTLSYVPPTPFSASARPAYSRPPITPSHQGGNVNVNGTQPPRAYPAPHYASPAPVSGFARAPVPLGSKPVPAGVMSALQNRTMQNGTMSNGIAPFQRSSEVIRPPNSFMPKVGVNPPSIISPTANGGAPSNASIVRFPSRSTSATSPREQPPQT